MMKQKTPYLYLALGIMQAIHSTEEYLTRLIDRFPVVTGPIHSVTGVFPVITMSERNFVVLNIALIVFLLSVGPFVFQEKRWALRVAKMAAIIETLNGIAHISAAVYIRGYYPGCLSAVGLAVVGMLLSMQLKAIKGSAKHAEHEEA